MEPVGDMAVYIHGSSHLGMAQAPLDYLGVDALPEHQASVGVPGIVEPVPFQPCPVHELPESSTEGHGEYGGATAVAEHWAIPVSYVSLNQAVHLLALPKGTEKEDR